MTEDLEPLTDDRLAEVLRRAEAAGLREVVAALRELQALRSERNMEALRQSVVRSLRDAISAHGPITAETIGSAAWRIVGNLWNPGRT